MLNPEPIADLIYGYAPQAPGAGERPRALHLDLYLPPEDAPAFHPRPLIIFVHGGAWMMGNKRGDAAPFVMLPRGYAVACVEYRFSQEAIWPAQIQDCKAAVRWLRAHAAEYDLDPARFGAWGPSAGGHLVAMLGTAGHVPEFEVGDNLAYPSTVAAVCDWFGPTDFLQMSAQLGETSHDEPTSPESLLVGGAIQSHPERVARANPITYIDGSEPPFLIIHGDHDTTVPCGQSVLLDRALRAAGVPCELHLLPGGEHGGAAFRRQETIDLVTGFFQRPLGA
jgi:acetyl esterase/lipase